MAIKIKTTFAFPEMFDLDTGKTKMFTGIRATNSNIGLLLRTSISEMFGDPYMGSRLAEFLFAPDIELVRDLITEHIRSVLENQQPTIEVQFVNLYYEENKEDTLHIKIDYFDKEVGEYYSTISDVDLTQIRKQSEGGNN